MTFPKISLLPREIASQIVLLVVLSAIIFHVCINLAFLVGRSYFPQGRYFIAPVIDFVNAAASLPAPQRDAVIAWLTTVYPSFDIKSDMPAGYAATEPNDKRMREELQEHAGPRLHIDLLESPGKPQRLGFGFADGRYVTSAIPSRPEPHPGPPPMPRAAPGNAMPPHDWHRGPGPHPPPLVELFFATLLFVAISFTIFLIWAIGSLTRPLRKFAASVESFSTDAATPVLAESGPLELRTAARALNRMRDRVTTMITQRTQMLAAIGHDLRTPVTRLRLRAEFIEPADIRDSVMRDLEQMNDMIDAALSFIRDGVEAQRNALLDLGALLQTIRDEFVDMGHQVFFANPPPTYIKGSADELHRAITNLVSNGVKFGKEVEIRLDRPQPDQIQIDVVDDGPGIPSESKAAMFTPFVRGKDAHNDQGEKGFGLGLPIAQAIVTAHHGMLELIDRQPHGVIARIILAA